MAASAEPTVSKLVTQAEALASRRHEPLRGVHLLAALGAVASSVSDLLEERGAGFRRVLDRWERLVDRGPPENLQPVLGDTRSAARRFGERTPTAPHLLLALLNDTGGSARRVLGELGVDTAGIRAAALQVAQGLPMRRRLASGAPEPSLLPETPSRSPRGVAVPVMPTAPVRGPHVERFGRTPVPRGAGQVVPIVPDVGPTPLPARRQRAGRADDERRMEEVDGSPASGGGSDRLDEVERSVPPPGFGDGAGSEAFEGPSARAVSNLELPRKKFPILTQVGRNLTAAAARGGLDPVVGRDEEIEAALDVLAKRHGNNPCLIGPAGVGKTSVARGIAMRLAEEASDERDPRLVIEIPISELVAGTGVRGALAGRLAALKKEVSAAEGRVILFFDEIHQLFCGEASEEIAADLKLSLARGELPCIGATSVDEYRRAIDSDPALSRRFSSVEIEEPTREDAFLVLCHVAERLQRHHGVVYEEEALALAISWSIRYLPGRALPDKAVSVIDLAGARSRRRRRPTVDPEAVAEVVASQASMPVERLLESDADRMLALEEILVERVIGHEQHMSRIARILRRNAAGLGSRRPIGTFLLLGPTGVGKTETAKAIAEVLFHSESAMTRIDMAEMSEAHAVAKLVGSPPGYVGHDAGGQLTEAVRRRPYQVVLLDEIEKAHPDVLTAFLAVFDEGRMTDSRGRLVDFTNTVIILTSNLGAADVSSVGAKRVGFRAGDEPTSRDVTSAVVQAARKKLAPELYNRIDEVLAFSPLSRSDVCRIGRKLVRSLADELELGRGVVLDVDDAAIEVLLDEGGYEPELGARPLRRTIARRIEAPLAEAILSGQVASGQTWRVRGEGGRLVCGPEPS